MQNYFCLVPALLIPLILIQGSGNAFGQNYEDLVRIVADFIPDDNEYTENIYDMNRFSLSYTNGSRLCPSNSCIFQFQDGYIDTSDPNTYFFNGILRVGTLDSSGGVNYKVYDINTLLEIRETTERPGERIHKVTGQVHFGEFGETVYEIYDGTLALGGGGVTLDINAQNPSLR